MSPKYEMCEEARPVVSAYGAQFAPADFCTVRGTVGDGLTRHAGGPVRNAGVVTDTMTAVTNQWKVAPDSVGAR